jgi:hypothetical protein
LPIPSFSNTKILHFLLAVLEVAKVSIRSVETHHEWRIDFHKCGNSRPVGCFYEIDFISGNDSIEILLQELSILVPGCQSVTALCNQVDFNPVFNQNFIVLLPEHKYRHGYILSPQSVYEVFDAGSYSGSVLRFLVRIF